MAVYAVQWHEFEAGVPYDFGDGEITAVLQAVPYRADGRPADREDVVTRVRITALIRTTKKEEITSA